jgi:hypothetical protein
MFCKDFIVFKEAKWITVKGCKSIEQLKHKFS